MTTEIIPGIQPDSERETWEIEASHWRLPYWDWAANQPYLQNVGIPELFTWQTVTVLMPNRRSQNFPNPLWKFSNPNGKPFGDASMGQWQIPAQPVSLDRTDLVSQLTMPSGIRPLELVAMVPSTVTVLVLPGSKEKTTFKAPMRAFKHMTMAENFHSLGLYPIWFLGF